MRNAVKPLPDDDDPFGTPGAAGAIDTPRRDGRRVFDDEPPPDADDHHAGEYAAAPADDDGPTDDDGPADLEGAILARLHLMRIQREARRRLDNEENPPAVPPPIKSLDTLLAEPDTPTRYRIADVAPAHGRIILSAQYKGGKTTIVGNVMRALADGEAFLGRFMPPGSMKVTKPGNSLSPMTRCCLTPASLTH